MNTDDKMIKQREEFDAAQKFIEAAQRLFATAIVDDDYPEMRHYYRSALRRLIDAAIANGNDQGRTDMLAKLREYSIARAEFESHTAPTSSHAMAARLPHGSPVTKRYQDARKALSEVTGNFTYYGRDGTLLNADGSRSIFDDVDSLP